MISSHIRAAAITAVLLLAANGRSLRAQEPLAHRRFIEKTPAQVAASLPELARLRPATATQSDLIARAAKRVDSMVADLVDVAATEQVIELKMNPDTLAWSGRQTQFRYVIEETLGDKRIGSAPQGFMGVSGFPRLLSYFGTARSKDVTVRMMGTDSAAAIVAFEVRKAADTPLLQGLAWIDLKTADIRRIYLDPIAEGDSVPLVTDVAFAPVRFEAVDTTLLLPLWALSDAAASGISFRAVHRFSAYRLDGIDDDDDPAQKARNSGVLQRQEVLAPDAVELLARANDIADPPARLPLLREALKLEPARPETHFQLAVSLWRAGQLAEAESEARQAMKSRPDSVVPQEALGYILMTREDWPGALETLRRVVALSPRNALAHFRLGEAMEKAGDATGALDEYKTASVLEPGSAEFAARLRQRTSAPVAAAAPPAERAEGTIRVDVRQVLVPVVVMRDGHFATGLRKEDFHVFENGVEQSIVSFGIEDNGVPDLSSGANALAVPPRPPGTPERAAPIRHSYLICVDAMHTEFANLHYAREALTKLFRQERSEDSQYAVVALGAASAMIRNSTRDTAAVLQALSQNALEKAFTSARHNDNSSAVERFQREVFALRQICDQAEQGDIMARSQCALGKRTITSQAGSLAEFERVTTIGFLRELRSMVQQMAAGSGRRSIILISDGFDMVAGRTPWDLIAAAFPDIREAGLRANERITGELEPILRLAQQRNVPIYTIDSRGLYTMPMYSAANGTSASRYLPSISSALNRAAQNAGFTLDQIAADTGGSAFKNRNDLFTGMQQAFADGRNYYLLAYVPSTPLHDGSFRNISVQVSDSKLQVKAKRGYWPEITR